jgi:hypothetical protein
MIFFYYHMNKRRNKHIFIDRDIDIDIERQLFVKTKEKHVCVSSGSGNSVHTLHMYTMVNVVLFCACSTKPILIYTRNSSRNTKGLQIKSRCSHFFFFLFVYLFVFLFVFFFALLVFLFKTYLFVIFFKKNSLNFIQNQNPYIMK